MKRGQTKGKVDCQVALPSLDLFGTRGKRIHLEQVKVRAYGAKKAPRCVLCRAYVCILGPQDILRTHSHLTGWLFHFAAQGPQLHI